MRCKKDYFVNDAYFHFYNRAINEERMFYQRDDYILLLKKLKSVLKLYPSTFFAYCLPRVIKCIINYVGNYNQNDLSLVYVFMKI